jgi:hypothetical protein
VLQQEPYLEDELTASHPLNYPNILSTVLH